MQTTLNEIKKYNPSDLICQKLSFINSTDSIDFMTILKAVGIQDAIWCLRVLDYRDYCLFLADVAESVLPIFEITYPGVKEPRHAIKAIRDWHNGDINTKQLNLLSEAALDTAYADTYGYIYDTTFDAAYAAAAAATKAYAATTSAAARAAVNAGSDWEKIEKLFIKHFS